MSIDRPKILIGILGRPPSASAWSALHTLFNSWPESEGLERALAQAEEALETWEDGLRLGNSWWEGAAAGIEPRWRLARSYSFHRRGPPLSSLKQMRQRSAFSQIVHLNIGAGVGPELVQELADGLGDESHLTGLVLRGRQLGELGAATLASLNLPNLQSLDVSSCDLGRAGVEALMKASWARGLKSLKISESLVDAEGAKALAEAGLEALEVLQLMKTPQLDDSALIALCGGSFPSLRELDLSECGFSASGLEVLAAAGHLKNLHKLNLWNMGKACGDAGAKAMAKNWALPAVRDLNIGACEIKDRGAITLAGCDAFSTVHTLDVSRNKFGAKGMRALANSDAMSGVRQIQMNWCKAVAIKAMAGSRMASSIEVLMIPRTECRDAGLIALLEGDGLAAVHTLDLTNNRLTGESIDALTGAANKLVHLRTLILADNKIATAAKVIVSSPLAASLSGLNLKNCHIGESGLEDLCAGDFPSLETLELSAKDVTKAGLKVMVQRADSFPKLREFKFKISLFKRTPKEQLELLAGTPQLALAAYNGGQHGMKKLIPGLESVLAKVPKTVADAPIAVPTISGPPTARFELPATSQAIDANTSSLLKVAKRIGMGSIRQVRWTSNEELLVVTKVGLYKYDCRSAGSGGGARHVSDFVCNAFGSSNDGRFIAAQLPYWKGGLLDVVSGALSTWDIKIEKGFVAVAFTSDNRRFAILSEHANHGKGLLRIRDRETGQQQDVQLDFSPRSTASLVWSPDDSLLAIGAGPNHAIVTASGEVKASWYLGTVNAVAFSRDGQRLITATRASNMSRPGDKFLRVWDLDGNLLNEVATPHEGMYSDLSAIATHPDNRTVAVGGRDQHLHIFDGKEWVRKHLLKSAALDPYTRPSLRWGKVNITHLAFSPKGDKLVVCTGNEPTSLQVWETKTWKRVHLCCDFVSDINDFGVSNDGQTLTLATSDQARSYSVGQSSPKLHRGWKGPYLSAAVDNFLLLADGKRAVLTSGVIHDTFTFGLLDLKTAELDTSFKCKKGPRALALSPAEDVIATGDDDGRISLFKPGRKSPLRSWLGHSGSVAGLHFSDDGEVLLSCSKDGTLRAWNSKTMAQIFAHTAPGSRPRYSACAISKDGRWVAGTAKSKVFVWDESRSTPKELDTNVRGSIKALAFSPDAKVLAVGHIRSKLFLIRTEDMEVLAEYDTTPRPTKLQFDASGQLLYELSDGGLLKVWAVST